MFHLYMPVRCCITDVEQSKESGSWTVTVNPKVVNANLKKFTLTTGMVT